MDINQKMERIVQERAVRVATTTRKVGTSAQVEVVTVVGEVDTNQVRLREMQALPAMSIHIQNTSIIMNAHMSTHQPSTADTVAEGVDIKPHRTETRRPDQPVVVEAILQVVQYQATVAMKTIMSTTITTGTSAIRSMNIIMAVITQTRPPMVVMEVAGADTRVIQMAKHFRAVDMVVEVADIKSHLQEVLLSLTVATAAAAAGTKHHPPPANLITMVGTGAGGADINSPREMEVPTARRNNDTTRRSNWSTKWNTSSACMIIHRHRPSMGVTVDAEAGIRLLLRRRLMSRAQSRRMCISVCVCV